MSFREAGHGNLSAVSQDRSREDGAEHEDEDSEVAAVISSAADAASGDVELRGPIASAADSSASVAGEGRRVVDSSDAGEKPSAAPEVFSSKTLALPLTDILLAPMYAAQLASFAKHLVGEFNVEPLLFFFKVRAFQTYVNSAKEAPAAGPVSINADHELSISVQDDTIARTGKCDCEKVRDHDISVAWRALMLFFEFLDGDAPSQLNIGHLVSKPIIDELSEAIVDFRQLHPHTPVDDVELRRPIDSKVFDRAHKNVFVLLERDPFVRWRKAIRNRVTKESL